MRLRSELCPASATCRSKSESTSSQAVRNSRSVDLVLKDELFLCWRYALSCRSVSLNRRTLFASRTADRRAPRKRLARLLRPSTREAVRVAIVEQAPIKEMIEIGSIIPLDRNSVTVVFLAVLCFKRS